MSTAVQTPECFPQSIADRLFLGGFVPEPRHADCPGGHHVRGVMGGWHCPCPCHTGQDITESPAP